jgi:hypothetical protein
MSFNSEEKTNEQIYNSEEYCGELDVQYPLDVIFANLDNISGINIGDKLTHDNKYITTDTSYLKSITRMYYGQSRYTNLDFINGILMDSYKHLNKLRKHNDDTSGIVWIKLISKLKNALNGLVKLRQTYSNDDKYTKQIDIIIKKLCKNS